MKYINIILIGMTNMLMRKVKAAAPQKDKNHEKLLKLIRRQQDEDKAKE